MLGPDWAGEVARRTVDATATGISVSPAPRTAVAGALRWATIAGWRGAGAAKRDKTGVPVGKEVVRRPPGTAGDAKVPKLDAVGLETEGARRPALACPALACGLVGRRDVDHPARIASAVLPVAVRSIFAGSAGVIALGIAGQAGTLRAVAATGRDVAGMATRALPAKEEMPCRPGGGLGR